MCLREKSAQIREILISESAWEEMTCLFAPSLNTASGALRAMNNSNGLVGAYLYKFNLDALTLMWNSKNQNKFTMASAP